MLRKLIKYDMSAVWKNALMVSISSIVASVIAGAAMISFDMFNDIDTPIGNTFSTITLIVMILAISTILISVFAIGILVLERFYKNLFTDEGYLTFTLPVSRAQIIGAKTINAMFWSIYEIVLILASVIVMVISSSITGAILGIDPGTSSTPSTDILNIDGWWIGYAILIVLLSLSCIYYSVSVLQYSITLGSLLAKRARIIAIIGIYYLINMVLSFIGQTLMTVFVVFFGDNFFTFISSLSAKGMHIATYYMLGLGLIISLGLGILFHWLTVKALNRKLNLT